MIQQCISACLEILFPSDLSKGEWSWKGSEPPLLQYDLHDLSKYFIISLKKGASPKLREYEEHSQKLFWPAPPDWPKLLELWTRLCCFQSSPD